MRVNLPIGKLFGRLEISFACLLGEQRGDPSRMYQHVVLKTSFPVRAEPSSNPGLFLEEGKMEVDDLNASPF